MMNVGDKIAAVATPIARLLNLDCIDRSTGELRPDSRCAKTRDLLNAGRFADAFYERFWKGTTVEPIQYIVTVTDTMSYAVEAEDPQKARQAVKDGSAKLITSQETISVQPRQPIATR